jgi:hypothetical protein
VRPNQGKGLSVIPVQRAKAWIVHPFPNQQF